MYTQTPIRNYVPKGEQVEIIRQSLDGVCIIEYNGNRYPCRVELLADTPPVPEQPEINLGLL